MDVMAVLDRIVDGAVPSSLESQTLDFKTEHRRSADDTVRDLAEAAACFANAQGGTLVVGIADRISGPGAFVGHHLDVDRTRSRIYELTDPPLLVDAEIVNHRSGQVLIVHVPRSVTVHRVGTRMPTERVGADCRTMSISRIASVVSDRMGDDWSVHDSGVAAASVDEAAVAVARALLRSSPDPRQVRRAELATADLLRALAVVTPEGTLTNAGDALLGDSSTQIVRASYIFRHTPAGALAMNEQLSGSLVAVISRLFDLVQARNELTTIDLPGGQQLPVRDLPEAAVREAVINAVMHRDYRRTDRIVVEHSPTQLAVTSPGGFLAGITPENVLTAAPRSRNPQLASAIRGLGLAETAGAGVDRMYAEMARIGHRPPAFSTDQESVRVVMIGGTPNTALTRFVAALPPEESRDADTLVILLTLLSHKTVDAASLTPLLQKPSAEETQSVLARLSSGSAALLEPTRRTARHSMPTYRLREEPLVALGLAVSYRRRTSDQMDRKIIGLVRESGTINARMVRLLLDTDAQQTSRVLRDLVDREILTRTSSATRGRGVTYGPGPKFES